MSLLETIIGRGTTAAKPAASADNEGYVYFDTDLDKLQRSNGSAWQDIERADPAGGSGTASACKVYRNTTQALAATTLTPVQFNAEELDTDGYHESVTNPDRITIPTGKAGVFLLIGYLYTATTTVLLGRFTVNGTAVRGQSVGDGVAGAGLVVSAGPVSLADADIVRLEGFLNSAGNIGDAANAEQQCWASVVRIGD